MLRSTPKERSHSSIWRFPVTGYRDGAQDVTAGSNTLRPFKRHPRLADFRLAAQDGEAFGHNVAEIKSVCDSLRGCMLYPIVALALSTGMRRGELLALRWSDVDLDRAVLRVERSLEQTKAGLRLKPPKTNAVVAMSVCRRTPSPCFGLIRSPSSSSACSSAKAGNRRSFSVPSKASFCRRTA